jgi:hypothetical protein
MEKNLTAPPKRSRSRILFWVALIAAAFLLVYSYRYDLILLLPSVQADRLRQVSYDTQLLLPPSSQIVKFSDSPFQEGPFREWRFYWTSWAFGWDSWPRWYLSDPDSWCAKILIPESSYAGFKEAVSKKPDSSFDGPFVTAVVKWAPVNPEFERIIVGENPVECVEVSAWKEGGKYAIFIGYECK